MMLKTGHVLIYVKSEEDKNGDQELLVLFRDPNPIAGGELKKKNIVGNLSVLAFQWAGAGNILCVTNDIQKVEKPKVKPKVKSKKKSKTKRKSKNEVERACAT